MVCDRKKTLGGESQFRQIRYLFGVRARISRNTKIILRIVNL